MAVTKEQDGILKIIALGSCVAVIAVARRYRTIGMVHTVVPDSNSDPRKSRITPGYYADTAIPTLLRMLRASGVFNPRDIVIKLVGGSRTLVCHQDIGKRNILACRKALWQNKMAALAEDVGANHPRTVHVYAATGRVVIQSPGRGEWEL